MNHSQSTPSPFYANARAELEQPFATYNMQFQIGDYNFEETFLVLTNTSFPTKGLAFLRKHFEVLDTSQETIDFPKIQITMALTDEMQKCGPKPITLRTESKHTITEQSIRIMHASISVSNDYSIIGSAQSLSEYDENAKLVVAPATTIARDKRVAIIIANTINFPHTVTGNTKLAELQFLKPEETKCL